MSSPPIRGRLSELLDDAYQISFYLDIPHSNHPDAQVVDDQGSQFVMLDSVIMNLAVDLDDWLALEGKPCLAGYQSPGFQ